MLVGSAYGKVGLDASGVQVGVNQAKASLQSLQLAGEKIGGVMKTAGNALTLGLTVPLVAFGAASVKAALDSESAMAELNAVIKSTGGVAGVTAKAVTDYATAMQKVTKFDDEAIISGQSMLLTFTKIGKDVFPMASTAMLNMAEKFGSVDEAAMQLGKALNDPVQGVGALRRVGVLLSAQQEQQIKDFMAVGDAASAQKVILGELETEFGGLAEAAGATTAGKFIQFKNALGDLQEVVGAALLPSLISLTNALRVLVDWFMKLPPFMQNAIIGFGIFLAAVGPIVSVLGTLIQSIAAISTAWPAITAAFSAIVPVLGSIGTVITGTVLPALAAVIVPLLPIIAVVALVAAALYLLYAAFSTNFMGITDTVKMLPVVIPYLIKQMWDGVVNYFTVGWRNIKKWLATIVNGIVNYFKIDWSQIGKNIMAGIVNGISGGLAAVIAAAKRSATAALQAFKDALGIKSPSLKFELAGRMSSAGYIKGLANSMDPATIARIASRPVQNISRSAQENNTYQFGSGLTLRDAQRMVSQAEARIAARNDKRFDKAWGGA